MKNQTALPSLTVNPSNAPPSLPFSAPPPVVVAVAVAVASGTEGVRPRRLPPATEWDLATGIGPPPVKGAAPAPVPVTTTHDHDQRPARRRRERYKSD
jgi:hypothetical protein